MTISENLIDRLIQDIMKKENYTTFKKDESENSAEGDGYLGEITFLRVNACKNGIKNPYNIVIKSAKTSDEFRKQTPIREVYVREIYMYTKVFPTFRQLFDEYRLDFPSVTFAKAYTSCLESKKESIVLQNLKSIGFELHNRQIPMNLNHAHMVFAKYGKLHALSLALRHKKPLIFQTLTKEMTDLFGMFITQTKMVPSLEKDFRNAMNLLKEQGRTDLVRKYEKCRFFEEIDKISTKSTDPSDPASVILHGDCWNNNFMFKYEGLTKEQPTDMAFIDFQLSRVASPVYDLSYYFYGCCDRYVHPDLNFLMEVYHQNLTETLARFGCNTNDILPFEKLIEHWRKFGKYGLVMSLFIVRIELSHSTEAPDFADAADKGEIDNFLIYKIENQALYERRITDNYIQFAEHFL